MCEVIIPKMRDASGVSEITEKNRYQMKIKKIGENAGTSYMLKSFHFEAYAEQKGTHKKPVKKKKASYEGKKSRGRPRWSYEEGLIRKQRLEELQREKMMATARKKFWAKAGLSK